AWDRVREHGAAQAQIGLRGGQNAQVYFFDHRVEHGVLVGVLVADSAVDTYGSTAAADVVPRLSVQRKTDLAVFADIDDATTKMLGWSREDLLGRPSLEFVHPDDKDRAIESWMDMLASPGCDLRTRLRYRHADGRFVWLELTNHNLLEDPDQACVITEALDVSDEMAAHEAVRANEQLLRRVAETVPLGLLHLDRLGNVVYGNERIHDVLGVPKPLADEDPFANVTAPDRGLLDDALRELMHDGADRDLEVAVTTRRSDRRLCHVRLRALTDDDAIVSGAIVCVEDVTERAHDRAEMEDRATYDALTRCLNRESVLRRLDDFVDAGSTVGVVFVDLDHFKRVNDEYGHATGDAVLVAVSRRVQECVREHDIVGRLGGDEFLVVCPDVENAAAVNAVATRISYALTEPLALDEGPLTVQASIGVAIAGDGHEPDALVANADAAMYVSKRNGHGRPVAYEATYQ
ncbi:MAG: domain S-box-containing protein/diguanylate cyclase protein, partial [Actinomycetia bacterium]|nr:domain S-box-containing protein/diguanylate cyclase protein [Actinomycetes bacterium]